MDFLKYLPLAIRLMAHREDIERLVKMCLPIADQIMKVVPEAMPIIKTILAEVRPTFTDASRQLQSRRKRRRKRKAVK